MIRFWQRVSFRSDSSHAFRYPDIVLGIVIVSLKLFAHIGARAKKAANVTAVGGIFFNAAKKISHLLETRAEPKT
jgi:hypothetical protein